MPLWADIIVGTLLAFASVVDAVIFTVMIRELLRERAHKRSDISR
jgi:hypothetical protein